MYNKVIIGQDGNEIPGTLLCFKHNASQAVRRVGQKNAKLESTKTLNRGYSKTYALGRCTIITVHRYELLQVSKLSKEKSLMIFFC